MATQIIRHADERVISFTRFEDMKSEVADKQSGWSQITSTKLSGDTCEVVVYHKGRHKTPILCYANSVQQNYYNTPFFGCLVGWKRLLRAFLHFDKRYLMNEQHDRCYQHPREFSKLSIE